MRRRHSTSAGASEGASWDPFCQCRKNCQLDSAAIKKAEHWRIDAFELWCWRRRLRVPWTARRSNQSILKEISAGVHWKDWCWSWNSNTLATWCEELTHLKRPWCWERLKAGGEGDDRGWDGWMASPTQWTWVWVNSGSWWWTGRPGVLLFTGSQRVRHDWATELNCTEIQLLLECTILLEGRSPAPVKLTDREKQVHQACSPALASSISRASYGTHWWTEMQFQGPRPWT